MVGKVGRDTTTDTVGLGQLEEDFKIVGRPSIRDINRGICSDELRGCKAAYGIPEHFSLTFDNGHVLVTLVTGAWLQVCLRPVMDPDQSLRVLRVLLPYSGCSATLGRTELRRAQLYQYDSSTAATEYYWGRAGWQPSRGVHRATRSGPVMQSMQSTSILGRPAPAAPPLHQGPKIL